MTAPDESRARMEARSNRKPSTCITLPSNEGRPQSAPYNWRFALACFRCR